MSMNFVERFSRFARERGISELNFYILSAGRSGVSVFQGSAEGLSASNVTQVFIEGNVNGKRGTAFTEDLSDKAFDELTAVLEHSAALANADFVPTEISPLGKTRDCPPSDTARAAERLLALEKEILVKYPSVSAAMLNFSHSSRTVTLANSRMESMTDSYGAVSFGVRCAAKDGGQTQTCGEHMVSADSFDIMPHGLEAARRAVELLSAQPCAAGRYPVIFEGPVFARIFEHYMPTFFGSKVAGGTSLLAGKLGTEVASPIVSLRENPSGLVLRSFDDRGVPTREQNIIENGILKCYLNREGAGSGNGFRPSYRAAVSEGYTNIELSLSRDVEPDMAALCERVQNGLLIHECDGIFAGANAISGAFSLISKGWLIENGKITRPVCRITVAGNFFDLLKNITAAADDPRIVGDPGSRTFKTPSVFVGELSISGK